jgi:hypothetical protein
MARRTSGCPDAMEVDVLIQSVEGVETSSGKIRYVVGQHRSRRGRVEHGS